MFSCTVNASDEIKLKSAVTCCLAASALVYFSADRVSIFILLSAVSTCLAQAYFLSVGRPPCSAAASPSIHKPVQGRKGTHDRPVGSMLLASGPQHTAKFRSTEWESGVLELLESVVPNADGRRAMEQLVTKVRNTVAQLFPRATVWGTCIGNPLCSESFLTSETQVEIVVSLSIRIPLDSKTGRPNYAINRRAQERVCLALRDRLVALSGFRSVRSGFRGKDPKVTLLGTAITQTGCRDILADLYVNSDRPVHYAALVEEFQEVDPVVQYLLLLVLRWAHDRVMSHVVKGHLKRYAWTLLVIYFLQVREADELCAAMHPHRGDRQPWVIDPESCRPAKMDISKRAARLFRDFVEFYCNFDWRAEGVSVRLGQRLKPDASLRIHVVLLQEKAHVCPCIEDPFDRGQNLGCALTASGFARLQSELARATSLCKTGASLEEVLDRKLGAPQQGGFPAHVEEELEEEEREDEEENELPGSTGSGSDVSDE